MEGPKGNVTLVIGEVNVNSEDQEILTTQNNVTQILSASKDVICVDKQEKSGIDLPEILLLFQTLGFCLVRYDKDPSVETSQGTNSERNEKLEITLNVSCPKSGMSATLKKALGTCKCPSQEDAGNAEFWNISGCAPANQETIIITHSSLLPALTPMKKKLAGDLLNSALKVLNRKTGNGAEDNHLPKRTRSAESLPGDTNNLTINTNWEGFLITPPVGASSPIFKILDLPKLTENLQAIKQLVDSSLLDISRENAAQSQSKKRISKITPNKNKLPMPKRTPGLTHSAVTNLASKATLSAGKSGNSFKAPMPLKFSKSGISTTPVAKIDSGLRKDTPRPDLNNSKKNNFSKPLNGPPNRLPSKIPSSLSLKNKTNL